MASRWAFATDAASDAFCGRIAAEMVREFGVSHEEAVGRINDGWRGRDFLGVDIAYHELPEHWARTMYWSDGSFWCVVGAARDRLGLGPPVPRPYTPGERAEPGAAADGPRL